MAYDLQEQEQIDQLKAFWDRYGSLILSVLTVIALAIAGWRGWQYYQNNQSREAGAIYDALREAANKRDMARVADATKQLSEKYPRTMYAATGALMAAKSQYEHGDAKAARAALQWLVDSGADESLRAVGKIRLAGILLDEKAYDEGLKLLAGSVPAQFVAAVADRRGDLLLGLGKRDEARAAYQQAFDKSAARDSLRDVVKLKLDALSGPAA